MATRSIFTVEPVTAQGKEFNIDFEHRSRDGYWVCASPWAQNTDPSKPDGEIVLMGSDKNPGIKQLRIDSSPRFNKGVAGALKAAALYQSAIFISGILGVYSKEDGPGAGAVLSTMEGVDPELVEAAIVYHEEVNPTPLPPTAAPALPQRDPLPPAPAGVLLPQRAVVLIDTKSPTQNDCHFAFLVIAGKVDGKPQYLVLPSVYEMSAAHISDRKSYASKALQAFGDMGVSLITVALVQFISNEAQEKGESNAIADYLAKHGLEPILQDALVDKVTRI